jgi:replicative DNA helicase
LSNLRDSGAIEQDSDVVLLIYRDNYYNPTADATGQTEIIVAKNRMGKTGTVHMMFYPEKSKFENLF